MCILVVGLESRAAGTGWARTRAWLCGGKCRQIPGRVSPPHRFLQASWGPDFIPFVVWAWGR